MSLLFYPSESESALQIITQALELDSKAGIELTAKNLVVRLSDRSAAEKWKSERDVAGLTTKWFSNRYHQNQTRDKTDSSEQVSRMQHQVDFLTQELNSLKETVAGLVETKEQPSVEVKKPRSTQKPKASQKKTPEENIVEETADVEVKSRSQKKVVKSAETETTEVKPVEVKTRGRKKTT
jgi:regulator of replication initiation timing